MTEGTSAASPPLSAEPRMTIRRTLGNIRSDYRRLAKALGVELTVSRIFFSAISPTIMALTLYRISRYFYSIKLRPIAWLLYVFNCYLTGADISPSCMIGHSCLIGHANGVVLTCRLGNNVTVYGRNGVGGGRQQGDIGGGPGLPVVEDDVIIGWGASIVGTIRIGRGSTIGMHTLVIHDVPPDSIVVSSARAVLLPRKASEAGDIVIEGDLAEPASVQA